MQTAHRFICALGLAALSASSFGATTVYTSSAAFSAAVAPGAYTNTFDGLPPTPPNSFSSGAFSYTVSADGGLYSSGTFLGANQPGSLLTFNFTGATITALGANFYATDLGDAFQSTSMTVTLGDGTSAIFSPTSSTNGSFRGFTSTVGITSLTIAATDPTAYAGLDNLTVGVAAVPEPTTLALMALGIAGLLVARRRQA